MKRYVKKTEAFVNLLAQTSSNELISGKNIIGEILLRNFLEKSSFIAFMRSLINQIRIYEVQCYDIAEFHL